MPPNFSTTAEAHWLLIRVLQGPDPTGHFTYAILDKGTFDDLLDTTYKLLDEGTEMRLALLQEVGGKPNLETVCFVVER